MSTMTLDASKLVEHFHKAMQSLKYPKMVLPMTTGGKLVIKPASFTGKSAGALWVSDGKKSSEGGVLYYKVTPTGAVQDFARPAPQIVAKAMQMLCEDPVNVAAMVGKKTGCCCFCSRQLDNASSLYHGYGPICSEKFGLPWGDVPSEELKEI